MSESRHSFIIACVAAGITVLATLKSAWLLIDELHVYRVSGADVPVIDGETSDPIWRKISPRCTWSRKTAAILAAPVRQPSQFKPSMTVCVLIFCLFGTIRPVHSSSFPLRKTHTGWKLLRDGVERNDEHAYSEDKFSILLTNLNSVLAGDTTFHAGVSPVAGQPHSASGRGLHYTTGEGVSRRLGLASNQHKSFETLR